jgi:hypothetical protein
MLTSTHKDSGYWTICLIFRQKSLKELNKIISIIFLVAIKISFRLFSIPFFWFPPNRFVTQPFLSLPRGLKGAEPMIATRRIKISLAQFAPSLVFCVTLLCAWQGVAIAEAIEPLKKLPTLAEVLKLSGKHYSGGEPSKTVQGMTQSETLLSIKRNYDLILARREQLEISREVKGHFDKAVTQAEKKYEEGEDDISQSAITKLKLGLAGTLNDISQFQSDIELAQLKLEKYLGVQWAENLDISEPKFKPVNFPHKTVDEFLKNRSTGSKAPKGSGLFELKEAVIAVNKAREQLALAGKNRKMTRALLVTESANYDFGIGNEAELFEALIIYTRVLVGYYEAIHTFNVSVYRFQHVFQSQ